MTDPIISHDPPPALTSFDRNLAMFGYLCLFLTVFFAGVPAFITAILAYSRKGDADPVGASHYRFQIRSFWWCFWLTVLASAIAVAAVVLGLAGLTQIKRPSGASGLTEIAWAPSDWDAAGHLTPAVLLLLASIGLAVIATAWTWIASICGAMKLGLGKPIGRV